MKSYIYRFLEIKALVKFKKKYATKKAKINHVAVMTTYYPPSESKCYICGWVCTVLN